MVAIAAGNLVQVGPGSGADGAPFPFRVMGVEAVTGWPGQLRLKGWRTDEPITGYTWVQVRAAGLTVLEDG